VTAAVRCAPPDNKPTPAEFNNCRAFLVREFQLLRHMRVVVALGHSAFDAFWAARHACGHAIPRPRPQFAHARVYPLGEVTLIGSYHPSQRNTQTGMLTHAMFDRVFASARELLQA
jgi:uracil-DNA glycosylase family 4